MKITYQQLPAHLKNHLHPIYILSGNEPLLVQESCLMIRQHAQQQDFEEYELMHAESGFQWESLVDSALSLSLFAQKKIIELRIPNGKPGDKGAKALMRYCENLNSDTLLIIVLPKLEAAISNSKWYKRLDQYGVSLPIWPLESHQFPAWLKQRVQQKGLNIDDDAVKLLAQQVDGNLLAAAQEVEKLCLLETDNTIDLETIEQSVGDSSRYDVFALVDSALSGNTERCLKILQSIQNTGTEPVLVLWALSKECRLLLELSQGLNQGKKLPVLFKELGIWQKKQTLYQTASQRHTTHSCHNMLVLCQNIDECIKGLAIGDTWLQLTQLSLNIAGVDLFNQTYNH